MKIKIAGADPGAYAWTFVKHVESHVAISYNKDASDIFFNAYQKLQESEILGACTAGVVCIYDNLLLTSAIVGDCGFRVIRKGSVEYKSEPQQAGFNQPYQFCNLPGIMTHAPKDAMIKDLKLQIDDKVVIASDGLFDNIYDTTMIEILNESTDSNKAAVNLVSRAKQNAEDRTCVTPWSDAYNRQRNPNDNYKLGGKKDDIVCTVVTVESTMCEIYR